MTRTACCEAVAEEIVPVTDPVIPATIVEIVQETPTIKSFLLDYGDLPYAFIAGQWLQLALPDVTDAKVSYSITSAPHTAGRVQLAIKAGNSHPVTRHLYEQAQVGDEVRISHGQGRFCFDRTQGDHVVLLGGGVGVTPLLSILRHIDAMEPGVKVTLLYSVAAPEEVLFAAELAAMAERNPAVELLITVTRPQAHAWEGLVGRIDEAMLRAAGAAPESVHFICGPNQMVDDTVALLQGMGIPEARLVYEKWW